MLDKLITAGVGFRCRDGVTLNELHDDVDGLLLGTNSDQLHDVRMVVLLQDPAERMRRFCT